MAGERCALPRSATVCRPPRGEPSIRALATPVSASEDFGSFGTEWEVPSVFWYVGGTDPEQYRRAEQAGRVADDIPTNHNPAFAPVIDPTLATGVEAMVAAALDGLDRG
jgi:hippurate hydrolase